ncbi:MAG TPA: SCP2 sterol-binding domain-containing protein [Micromonosporaceae bacterium]|jgi:putative sterol carrier protein
MPSATEGFFADLASRPDEPLLRAASGTIRIDLDRPGGTDRWFVTIDRGAVAVSKRSRTADCRVRIDADLFDRIASGETNALAALLRGQIAVEGDLELLMMFQRLLPGRQTNTSGARRLAGAGRGRTS